MDSQYYLKAKEYYDNLEDDEAKEVCEEGIKNKCFDCAFLLGEIYLNTDEPNIEMAISNYILGANNGIKGCLYELAKIYDGESYKEYKDDYLAINYYFESNLYVNKDIDLMISLLNNLSKESSIGKEENSINFIKDCTRWIFLAKDSKLLRELQKCKEKHLDQLSKRAANKSYKSLDEFDENYIYLNYLSNDKSILPYWKKFERNRVKVFLKDCKNINEAINYRIHFEFSDNKNDLDFIYNDINEWIVNSYLNDKNDAKKYITEDDVIHYCASSKSMNTDFIKAKNGLIINYAKKCIEAFDFKKIKYCYSIADSIELKDEIDKSIISFVQPIVEEHNFIVGRQFSLLVSNEENKRIIRSFVRNQKMSHLQFESDIMRDPSSIAKLIVCYFNGFGIKKDRNEALKRCEFFCEVKFGKVEFNLVYPLFENNDDMAYKLLNSAIDNGIVLNEKQKLRCEFLNRNNLLIFDFDGTIFDTDFLRNKRRANSTTNLDYYKVNYIRGFKELFLNEKSKLYLGNNDIIIISSSRENYLKSILEYHKELKEFLTYPTMKTSKKKTDLSNFLSSIDRTRYKNIIAFGDDEKDANVYSELNLQFYIVPNFVGYGDEHEVLTKSKMNLENFRNKYLYDLKRIDLSQFKSEYIDDIVVYYKNYNCTKVVDIFTGFETGSDYCPPRGELEPLNVFDGFELGKKRKHETLTEYGQYFAETFDDLLYNDDIIISKVPSHDEVIYNPEKPMSKIVNMIHKKHSKCINGVDLLLRREVVEESKYKGSNRNIKDQLETIVINPAWKDIFGKTIYLFDDIFTSGTTMMACVEKLYNVGAGHVVCFCIARTCGYGKYAPVEIE